MPTEVIAPPVAGQPAGRRGCVVRPAPSRRRTRGHLCDRHPLARLVRDRCRALHPQLPVTGRLGRVGCGVCWEFVIRADERFATEEQLPALCGADAAIVDQVAIDRAIAGVRVRLRRAERVAAVAQLAAQGVGPSRVAARLRMGGAEVARLWPTTETTAGLT